MCIHQKQVKEFVAHPEPDDGGSVCFVAVHGVAGHLQSVSGTLQVQVVRFDREHRRPLDHHVHGGTRALRSQVVSGRARVPAAV